MKKNMTKYAGVLLASTVVIGGIATAAITPIPTISNTFAVAGQVIKSTDINKLAEGLNILDARTNGTAPTDPNHLADKEYVDAAVSASSAWVEVPLTDTALFDSKCDYVWDAPNGGSFKASHTTGANIRFEHAGWYESYASVIFASDKTKAKAQHVDFTGTPGVLNGQEYADQQPTKIWKRCN